MKIIKLKIKGGLGNQFFQISFAYSLLKIYPGSILIADTKWFNENKIRNLIIKKTPIKTLIGKNYLNELPISKYFSSNKKISLSDNCLFIFHDLILFVLKIYRYLSNIFYFISPINHKTFSLLSKIGIFTDDNRSYIDFQTSYSRIITVSGYFQNIDYIKKYKSDLSNLLLKIPELPMESYLSNSINKSIGSFSCLIRLGSDYIFNIDPKLLIFKSIKISKGINKESNYIFFSDDKKELDNINIDIKNAIFCEAKDPLIQLYIASLSENFIISNSSFAWWAYFLSPHQNKTIIKPKEWIKNDLWNPGFLKSDKIIDIEF